MIIYQLIFLYICILYYIMTSSKSQSGGLSVLEMLLPFAFVASAKTLKKSMKKTKTNKRTTLKRSSNRSKRNKSNSNKKSKSKSKSKSTSKSRKSKK